MGIIGDVKKGDLLVDLLLLGISNYVLLNDELGLSHSIARGAKYMVFGMLHWLDIHCNFLTAQGLV